MNHTLNMKHYCWIILSFMFALLGQVRAASVPISYGVRSDSQVSLAVYDRHGAKPPLRNDA